MDGALMAITTDRISRSLRERPIYKTGVNNMKFAMWVALLVIGVGQAVGGDDGALPQPGEILAMVGGSEPASQYQQYYDTGGIDQSAGGPIQFMVSGSEPESLVVNVPMNSYWIQGGSSWTQYIKCPMFARFKLLAYSQGGLATVREEYADGTEVKKDFQYFPGYTRQTFTADIEGRHVIGFEINGQLSNAVIVDVEPQGSQTLPPNLPGTVQNPTGSSGQNIGTTSTGVGSSGQKNDPGI
jgi:hypothetical protein